MELNEQDFIRLRLKTKTIKHIQRLQSEFENAPVVEEFIDNDSEEEKPEVASFSALPSDKQSGNDDIDQGEDSDDDEPIDNTTPNPYKSIVLEKVSILCVYFFYNFMQFILHFSFLFIFCWYIKCV